jgi:peptidoglycan/LPS O-acetylase OafA/YrhL
MKHIPSLNGLRGIAVLLVVLYHWGLPPVPAIPFLDSILPDGRFGVNVFFVLSGFLISSILLIEKDRKEDNKKIIINFYIRRLLRICPIYYLTIFVLYFCNLPGFNKNLPFYLTYTENFNVFLTKEWDKFSHSWSLAVEEQFYLIWPFIIVFSKKEHLLKVLIFIIFLGPVFSLFQARFLYGIGEYVLTPTCFDSFGIGALLAYYNVEKNIEPVKKWVKLLLPLSILLTYYWNIAPSGGHFQYFRRFFESIVAAGLILFCLSDSFSALRVKLLENRVMNQLGIVSYGIYLFHFPLPDLYWKTKQYFPFSFGAVDVALTNYLILVFILIFLAFLSYYLVEKPILRFKNRFKY